MIVEAIGQLIDGKNLPYATAAAVMEEIMSGNATQAQISAFLTALCIKGETIDEITASAQVMRDKAIQFHPDFDVMDIVGTGGDHVGTFNISTTAAFIVAAGGIPVAKHGNRSVSSKSGAADVLERLGVVIDLPAEQNMEILKEIGITFLFAPVYHSSMKYAAPVRREIGVRTIFNILGPLLNPARASMEVMGVFSPDLVEPLAQVLSNLGVRNGIVIHGSDGLDEVTINGKTMYCAIRDGKLTTGTFAPEDFGLQRAPLETVIGGNPQENAAITKAILNGEERGSKRDIVVLNAALALFIGGKSPSIRDGVVLAQELIDNGKAAEKLNQLAALTTQKKGV